MIRPTLKTAKRLTYEQKQRAIRRVLRLVDGYLSTRDQTELVAWNGGMMTWRELRWHIKAALKL